MDPFQNIDAELIHHIIRPRPLIGHKGTFGHALLIAGSEGTIGAAILSAKAALRTGCGLLSLHITEKATTAVMSQLPEAMIIPRKKKVKAYPDYSRFNAIGIGPGLGLTKSSNDLLLDLLKFYRGTLVIDADAITLLSRNRHWLEMMGAQVVFTPHPKEFDRLTSDHSSEEERYATQLAFSKEHKVTVVLKGHRTVVTSAAGETYRNTTGNNGMATAGSGDVLTGIITSLCAQGYSAEHAAITGTFLHGFAGDIAARKMSYTSMIASDIIAAIPGFFLEFEQ